MGDIQLQLLNQIISWFLSCFFRKFLVISLLKTIWMELSLQSVINREVMEMLAQWLKGIGCFKGIN